MAKYCFMPSKGRTVVSDTACQSSAWANSRLRPFFRHWHWVLDHYHSNGHKCLCVNSPSQFSALRRENTSFVEQLHAVQRYLGLSLMSTSMPRTVFLVQLVNDDIYRKEADRRGLHVTDPPCMWHTRSDAGSPSSQEATEGTLQPAPLLPEDAAELGEPKADELGEPESGASEEAAAEPDTSNVASGDGGQFDDDEVESLESFEADDEDDLVDYEDSSSPIDGGDDGGSSGSVGVRGEGGGGGVALRVVELKGELDGG
jgi:hypothetical protein